MSGIYQAHKLTTEISFELLKAVGKGGLLPFLALYRLLKARHPDLKKQQLRNRIEYYKRTGIVSGSAKDGYVLAEKGLQKLNALTMSKVNQTQTWDGKWRLIAFDIPEAKREARDALRRLIKELGCRQLQRSLWIHPLPCLDQFRQLQEAYDVKGDIVLLEVTWIDNQKELLQIFKKSYPELIKNTEENSRS